MDNSAYFNFVSVLEWQHVVETGDRFQVGTVIRGSYSLYLLLLQCFCNQETKLSITFFPDAHVQAVLQPCCPTV